MLSVKVKRFTVAALLLALTGALVAAFAPTGHVMESLASTGGVIVTHSYNVSMFQTDGSWVLVVVSVPVLLALVPVLDPLPGSAHRLGRAALGGLLRRHVVRRNLLRPGRDCDDDRGCVARACAGPANAIEPRDRLMRHHLRPRTRFHA